MATVKTPIQRDSKGRFAAQKSFVDRVAEVECVGPCEPRARNINAVLSGEKGASLRFCFTWASAPQGWQYWNDLDMGKRELSNDDREFLVALRNDFLRRSKGEE